MFVESLWWQKYTSINSFFSVFRTYGNHPQSSSHTTQKIFWALHDYFWLLKWISLWRIRISCKNIPRWKQKTTTNKVIKYFTWRKTICFEMLVLWTQIPFQLRSKQAMQEHSATHIWNKIQRLSGRLKKLVFFSMEACFVCAHLMWSAKLVIKSCLKPQEPH